MSDAIPPEPRICDVDSADARGRVVIAAPGPALRIDFGKSALRLAGREWLAVALLLAFCFAAAPELWQRWRSLETLSDYRIPYAASEDYWTYRRLIDRLVETDRIPILGDSFVWGEYVAPSDTIASFLNHETDSLNRGIGIRSRSGSDRFANAGLNGAHPLALYGLVRTYAARLANRRVILHCNLLWMSSADRDLRSESDVPINHASLLPQFVPRIPAYRAPLSRRLGVAIDRALPFFQLVDHVRILDFDGQDVPSWSIANPYSNPLARLDRGVVPRSTDANHAPISWTQQGLKQQELPWIDLDVSLQWWAWRQTAECLRSRGNRLLVVIGPFNEHLLLEPSRRRYRALEQKVEAWLREAGIRCVAPGVLPSAQYGDASHPLSAGYAALARSLCADRVFREWLADTPQPTTQ